MQRFARRRPVRRREDPRVDVTQSLRKRRRGELPLRLAPGIRARSLPHRGVAHDFAQNAAEFDLVPLIDEPAVAVTALLDQFVAAATPHDHDRQPGSLRFHDDDAQPLLPRGHDERFGAAVDGRQVRPGPVSWKMDAVGDALGLYETRDLVLAMFRLAENDQVKVGNLVG